LFVNVSVADRTLKIRSPFRGRNDPQALRRLLCACLCAVSLAKAAALSRENCGTLSLPEGNESATLSLARHVNSGV